MLQGFVPFVSQNKLMLKHNQLLVAAVSRSSFVSLVPSSPFILPYIHTYIHTVWGSCGLLVRRVAGSIPEQCIYLPFSPLQALM